MNKIDVLRKEIFQMKKDVQRVVETQKQLNERMSDIEFENVLKSQKLRAGRLSRSRLQLE